MILTAIGVVAISLVTTFTILSDSSLAAEPFVGISVSRLSPEVPNPLGAEPTKIGAQQLAYNRSLEVAFEVGKRHSNPYPYAATYYSEITLGQANALLTIFPFTETTEYTQGHKSYLGVLSFNNERYAVLLLFS